MLFNFQHEINIFFQQTLDYIHSVGVIHRDLRPDNICYDPDSKFILINDFTCAQFLDQKFIHKTCGELGFMAPEIVNQIEFDQKVDIFSLGIIFSILICKYNPLIGEDENDTIQKTKDCDINFDDQQYQNVEPLALDLLKNLLEQDQAFRFTAQEALRHDYFLDNENSVKSETELQNDNIYNKKSTIGYKNKPKLFLNISEESKKISENLDVSVKRVTPINVQQINFQQNNMNLEENQELQKNNSINQLLFKNNQDQIDIQSNNFEILNNNSIIDKNSNISNMYDVKKSQIQVKSSKNNIIDKSSNISNINNNNRMSKNMNDINLIQQNQKNINYMVQSSINDSQNLIDQNQSYNDKMEIKDLMKQIPNFSEENIQSVITKNKQIFELLNKQNKIKEIDQQRNQIYSNKINKKDDIKVSDLKYDNQKSPRILSSIYNNGTNTNVNPQYQQNYYQVSKNMIHNQNQPDDIDNNCLTNTVKRDRKLKLSQFQQYDNNLNNSQIQKDLSQQVQQNQNQFKEIVLQQQNIVHTIDYEKRLLQSQFKNNSPISKMDLKKSNFSPMTNSKTQGQTNRQQKQNANHQTKKNTSQSPINQQRKKSLIKKK